MSSANSVGILAADTWRYYINNFGCSHFKGTGLEDNYYLLRPIILNNGERVKNKRTFLLAKEENRLVQGFDYIISSHSDAVLAAKIKYRIDLITPDEYSDVLAFIDKYHLLWLEENNHHVI